jgi:hypothetical protein
LVRRELARRRIISSNIENIIGEFRSILLARPNRSIW